MHTEEIIALLDDVKPAGNGSWTARCPNRDHRTARLSVKDAGDKTLLRCWGGCTVNELTSAVGISVGDLFVNEMTDEILANRNARFSYEDLEHERLIIQIASKSTRPLSEDDIERVKVARYRLRVGGWLKMSDDLMARDRRRIGWLS